MEISEIKLLKPLLLPPRICHYQEAGIGHDAWSISGALVWDVGILAGREPFPAMSILNRQIAYCQKTPAVLPHPECKWKPVCEGNLQTRWQWLSEDTKFIILRPCLPCLLRRCISPSLCHYTMGPSRMEFHLTSLLSCLSRATLCLTGLLIISTYLLHFTVCRLILHTSFVLSNNIFLVLIYLMLWPRDGRHSTNGYFSMCVGLWSIASVGRHRIVKSWSVFL